MTVKDSPFCGSLSLKGREWSFKRDQAEVTSSDGVSLAAHVAKARGFDPDAFFSASIKTEMPDPSSLLSMDDAVASFCNAVESGKNILIYGDYDVDGATSTSLVLRWLRAMGCNPHFYIPDRMGEGYGPNSDAIRRIHEELSIDFILFLDCGTTAHEPLGVAEELGIEIVIIDHHEQDDRDPPGILVNPKRRDEDRSLDYLCTAGLAFLFLVAVQREMRKRGFFTDIRPEVDLRQWLGIVALGTVADLVPLVGLNRAYVKAGLPRMGEVAGLNALNIANGSPGYNATTCGFVFGPCINASGRIGDTRKGTELLTSDDADFVAELAELLVGTNQERQGIQKEALDQAMEEAQARPDDAVVVLYNPDWHPGVVGLVASKVKDAMDRPAVIIGTGGAASCRSVEGFDLGRAVIEAREAGILIKGGGHAMAAGLTVAPERIDDLRAFLCEKAIGFKHPPIDVDLLFQCGTLTPAHIEELSALEPFGMKNPKPRVAIIGGWVREARVMKGLHLKLFLTGEKGETECVMWNGIGTPLGDALAESSMCWVDIYGTAKIDTFGGRRRATVMIEDAILGRSLDEAAA